MSRIGPLVVVVAIGFSALSPALDACGDKFMMVGRGPKFQRAYASGYPGNIVIYARPSADPKAAIRDTRLHKALRQAGHSVSVIEDWAILEQSLKVAKVDVVLVDVGEAARLQPIATSSPARPDTLYVAFPKTVLPPQLVCRLKSSDNPVRFLDEIENAMKARTKNARKS